MGFSSLDDLISELTVASKRFRADFSKTISTPAFTGGRWYDLSLFTGTPVINTYAGTGLAATIPDEASGWGIYHGGNVSTDTKHLLNAVAFGNSATAAPGLLALVDVCLYYPGISMTSASAQTLTNTSSLTRYTDGVGLRPYIAVTAATGANTPTVALSYTRQNTGGTDTGRALGATTAFTASAIVGHISYSGAAANNRGPFLPLQSTDTGIRSAQSITFTTPHATSGTCALVLCRPLAEIPLGIANVASVIDFLTQVPSLPRILDGACLNLLYLPAGATTNSIIQGRMEFVWG